jgi:hypothetical protein
VTSSSSPVTGDLPYGVPVKVWREVWRRPSMVFRRQAHMVFAVHMTAVTVFKGKKGAALPRVVITKRSRQQIALEVLRTVEAHRRKMVEDERDRLEIVRVQRQTEDDEELFTLALMLSE